jgi:hypothetical protein
MIRTRFVVLFVLLSILPAALATQAATRTLIGGRGIPVVSDPRDLSLINLKPLSEYLYADLKNKGDFNFVRRSALNLKADSMGIPDPRKKILHGGAVIARGPSGNLTTAVVLLGDLKFKNFKDALEKDYRDYMKTTNGTPAVSQQEIGGVTFDTFAYAERPYTMVVGQFKDNKALIVASIPQEDTRILEDTIQVLTGAENLAESRPTEVAAETTVTLSAREMERLITFNRPQGTLRQTFSKGMKNLSKKLGIPQSQDETVPLDERIRGQLSQSRTIQVTYRWDVDSSKASAYTIRYAITMKSPEQAEVLRGLVADQVVRLTEAAQHTGDRESLGKLSVAATDAEVNVSFLLDTPESQFQHVSLLLSQVLHYRSVFSLLDHGQKKE